MWGTIAGYNYLQYYVITAAYDSKFKNVNGCKLIRCRKR